MEKTYKIWYAVQRTREDDWGDGAWTFDEAVQMANEMGANIIAEIAIGNDPVCINEYVRTEEGDWD